MNRTDWWHLGVVYLLLFGWWAVLILPLVRVTNELLDEAKRR